MTEQNLDTSSPVDLDALRAAVTKQAGHVRQLKADGATPETVQQAVAQLQALRKQLEELTVNEESNDKFKVDKRALEDALSRRMFIVPSFEIHGGVSGLFDYGPPGSALKEEMVQLWRRHFILEDNLLQIECTTLTPYNVLKASGHVDKFEDLMVKDAATGDCYRADKLLEDHIERMLETDKTIDSKRQDELRIIKAQADAFSPAEIKQHFADLGIKAPLTGNDLTDPYPFNLMFQTSIGPTGQLPGFLRPETAQGMFVNFRRLYDYNNGKMPMGVAQVGTAYRNEIAPRNGLLRVREFSMAEIEYFVHPQEKDHVKFSTVADLKLNLFPKENQVGDGKLVSMTLREAVEKGTINNETLAYFLGRTAMFFHKIGIRPEGLRFRQHLDTEMAHYASDCWDAEVLMSSGWVECAGHADRSAYDLEVHSKATRTELVAKKSYPEPIMREVVVLKSNKGLMGRQFRAENAAVQAAIEELAENKERAQAAKNDLETKGETVVAAANGKEYTITKDMLTVTFEMKKISEEKYIPHVIEPSYGIGRIITGILEHTFYIRESDEQRAVFAFPPCVAPVKVIVLPLDNRIDVGPIRTLCSKFSSLGVSFITDESSASVGRRYARADEIGVPFAITYDHETPEDQKVTLRERDSTRQVRVPVEEVPALVKSLVDEMTTWEQVTQKYPLLAVE